MKKIFALAALVLFTMTSCSGDDSQGTVNQEPGTTPVTENTILLKKMIETDAEGNIITTDFEYNGTKLLKSVSSDGGNIKYTYEDDLITKIEIFENNSLVAIEKYGYNTQSQLTNYLYLDYNDETSQRIEYIHNNDGTISYQLYSGDLNTEYFDYDGKIYMNKREENMLGEFANVDTNTYTYDGKNSPTKNITGFDKIHFAGTDYGINSSENPTSTIHSNTLGLSEVISTITYTYNSNQYPVTSSEVVNINASMNNTIQYFYE